MLGAGSCPVEAGRMYYVRDRMHDPRQMVVAEKLVPCGQTQLWVVRDGRGLRFVCAEAHLADGPGQEVYCALQQTAPADPL